MFHCDLQTNMFSKLEEDILDRFSSNPCMFPKQLFKEENDSQSEVTIVDVVRNNG
jgi:hypothetical protein